tara:strand:- start:309 stop:548 length:240 start_codon:yes stop_codon:yes gene_type:complete
MTTESQFGKIEYALNYLRTKDASILCYFLDEWVEFIKANPDATPSQLKVALARFMRNAVASQSAYAKTHPHPVTPSQKA